jgi:hypothetical protein
MESPTTLAGFAEQYRLRVKREGCGDPIIRVKFGHLCEHCVDRHPWKKTGRGTPILELRRIMCLSDR